MLCYTFQYSVSPGAVIRSDKRSGTTLQYLPHKEEIFFDDIGLLFEVLNRRHPGEEYIGHAPYHVVYAIEDGSHVHIVHHSSSCELTNSRTC